MDEIDQYKKLLGKIGQKFPEKFVLQDMIDLKYKMEHGVRIDKGADSRMLPKRRRCRGKARSRK